MLQPPSNDRFLTKETSKLKFAATLSLGRHAFGAAAVSTHSHVGDVRASHCCYRNDPEGSYCARLSGCATSHGGRRQQRALAGSNGSAGAGQRERRRAVYTRRGLVRRARLFGARDSLRTARAGRACRGAGGRPHCHCHGVACACSVCVCVLVRPAGLTTGRHRHATGLLTRPPPFALHGV